jgi:hypothetical protein
MIWRGKNSRSYQDLNSDSLVVSGSVFTGIVTKSLCSVIRFLENILVLGGGFEGSARHSGLEINSWRMNDQAKFQTQMASFTSKLYKMCVLIRLNRLSRKQSLGCLSYV